MAMSLSGRKTIGLPMAVPDQYPALVEDLERFRTYLDEMIGLHPELFPPPITSGYRCFGTTYSQKQQLKLRRIQLFSSAEVYQLRPDFVMPYMIGQTAEVEQALFLRRYGVPYEALVYGFGRDPMYWLVPSGAKPGQVFPGRHDGESPPAVAGALSGRREP